MKSYWLFLALSFFLALGACGVEETGPAPTPRCGWYTHLDKSGTTCVADYPSPPCSRGTHVDHGVCVADETAPKCGLGTEVRDGLCVPTNEAVEVCDGVDNNGDGQVDESDPNLGVLCIKQGYPSGVLQWGSLLCGWNVSGQKVLMCSGPTIKSPEACGNGVDDNGDGQVDEGCNPPPPVVTIQNVVQPWWTLTKNSNQNLMEFEVTSTSPIKVTSLTVGVYLSNPTGNSSMRLYVDGQWVIFVPGKWGTGNLTIFYPHTPVSSVPVRFTVTGDTTELPGNPGDFVQMTLMGLTTDPVGVAVTGAGISGPMLVFK